MILRDWTKTPMLRLASGVLAVATLALLWTAVRALRADPLRPDSQAATAQTTVALSGMTRGSVRPIADIQGAVENDLFSPDRTAPDAPYRMPGEASADAKPRVEPAKPIVLGTAVASDGRSFATLQLGVESPKLVHVGDRIGDWIVRSIARGKVVLESTEGARAELAVPKPGL